MFLAKSSTIIRSESRQSYSPLFEVKHEEHYSPSRIWLGFVSGAGVGSMLLAQEPAKTNAKAILRQTKILEYTEVDRSHQTVIPAFYTRLTIMYSGIKR